MSIFETLTNEDLPLSFRFPKFSTRVKYPTNSVVLFDASTTNDPIYRVYISIATVNPNRAIPLDPVASIVAVENLWRDITGRHITDISGVNIDSDTIQFTFDFDEGQPDVFEVDVSNLGRGGVRLFGDATNSLYQTVRGIGDSDSNVTIRPSSDGTTLEFSVSTTVESNSAMYVESDGSLNFNAQLLSTMGDSDAAAERIRTFLRIGDTPLVFEENADGEQVLTYYIDSDGDRLTIRNTYFRTAAGSGSSTTPSSTANALLVLEFSIFDPIFSVFAIDDNTGNVQTSALQTASTYLWDRPASGFAVTIDNPDDTPGEHITINNVSAVSGGIIESDLSNYQQFGTHTLSGASQTVRYAADTVDAFMRPDVTSTQQDTFGGVLNGHVEILETRIVAGSPVVTTHNDATTGNFSITWNAPPSNAVVNINSGNNLPSINFLGIHRSTSYTVTAQTGALSNPSNFTVTVSVEDGSITSTSGSGTITFNIPIHKNTVISSADTPRIAAANIRYNRPATVTGSQYFVDRTNQSAALTLPTTSGYDFPSFWFIEDDASVIPTLDNIVRNSGTGGSLSADFIRGTGSSINGLINVRSQDNINQLGVIGTTPFISLSTGASSRFWFGIRQSFIDATPIVSVDIRDTDFPQSSTPVLITESSVGDMPLSLSPIGLGSTTGTITDGYAGYVAEPYRLYSFLAAGNISAIIINT